MEKAENLEMLLRACLKIRTERRVRARGLQDTPKNPILCRAGPLTRRRVRARGLQDTPKNPILCRPGRPPTGRIFKQALRLIAG